MIDIILIVQHVKVIIIINILIKIRIKYYKNKQEYNQQNRNKLIEYNTNLLTKQL